MRRGPARRGGADHQTLRLQPTWRPPPGCRRHPADHRRGRRAARQPGRRRHPGRRRRGLAGHQRRPAHGRRPAHRGRGRPAVLLRAHRGPLGDRRRGQQRRLGGPLGRAELRGRLRPPRRRGRGRRRTRRRPAGRGAGGARPAATACSACPTCWASGRPGGGPGLRGAYLGLRREHGRPHLVRAAVEGVCQQLALVRDSFDAEGCRAHRGAGHRRRGRLRTVGRRRWPPPSTCRSRSPTPRRAPRSAPACSACTPLGELPDLDEAAALVGVAEPTRPDPADAALYARLRPLVEKSALAMLDTVRRAGQAGPRSRCPTTEKATGPR